MLAAGQQTRPDPDNKPATVNVVTLLLKPLDAEKLVLATSLGTIHFVLRNITDRQQAPQPNDRSMRLKEVVGKPETPRQTSRTTKGQSRQEAGSAIRSRQSSAINKL